MFYDLITHIQPLPYSTCPPPQGLYYQQIVESGADFSIHTSVSFVTNKKQSQGNRWLPTFVISTLRNLVCWNSSCRLRRTAILFCLAHFCFESRFISSSPRRLSGNFHHQCKTTVKAHRLPQQLLTSLVIKISVIRGVICVGYWREKHP